MSMRWLVTMLAAGLAGAPGAHAATQPAQGSVDAGKRVQEFAGQIDTKGQVAWVDVVQGTTGGMHGTCVEPFCQSMPLKVSGSQGGDLHVAVRALNDSGGNVTIEIERPDGTTSYAGAGYATGVLPYRHLVIHDVQDGDHIVRVAGEGRPATNGIMDFGGAAWIVPPGEGYSSGLAWADGIVCPGSARFEYPAVAPGTGAAPVDDPLYARQWGLQQMRVPAAWRRGFDGKGVTIAVIDSGVDLHHPDLVDRLRPGADVTAEEATGCAPGAQDDHGHGTAVASIAAASADDATGLAGVAPKARVLPIKVVTKENTLTADDFDEAIDFAIERGADVINLSLGGNETDPLLYLSPDPSALTMLPRLSAAAERAWDAGVVVIAAAGNSMTPLAYQEAPYGSPLCAQPARAPHALCVAATGPTGEPAAYSAHPNGDGLKAGVRAPGGAGGADCNAQIVTAAWPGGFRSCDVGSTAYGAGAGTSYAAPHVAGVAAMLKQAGLSPQQIVDRIKRTASQGDEPDPVMGYGIVDARAATAGLEPRGKKPKKRGGLSRRR